MTDAPFIYNSLSNLKPYFQYPQSFYGVSTMACMSFQLYAYVFSFLSVTGPSYLPVLTSTLST